MIQVKHTTLVRVMEMRSGIDRKWKNFQMPAEV